MWKQILRPQEVTAMMGFGGFGFIKNKPQVFNDNNIIFFENLQCIN